MVSPLCTVARLARMPPLSRGHFWQRKSPDSITLLLLLDPNQKIFRLGKSLARKFQNISSQMLTVAQRHNLANQPHHEQTEIEKSFASKS